MKRLLVALLLVVLICGCIGSEAADDVDVDGQTLEPEDVQQANEQLHDITQVPEDEYCPECE